MQVFKLYARGVLDERVATVTNDGSGLVVDLDGTPSTANSVDHAISIARLFVRDLLAKSERAGQEWSLSVSVMGISLHYGVTPPTPVIPLGGSPLPRNDLVSRIFREYQEGDGARKALDNAIRIIRAVTESRGRLGAVA